MILGPTLISSFGATAPGLVAEMFLDTSLLVHFASQQPDPSLLDVLVRILKPHHHGGAIEYSAPLWSRDNGCKAVLRV
jgi:hypothetical protein